MDRYEAYMIILKILSECDHNENCRTCPFGIYQGSHIGQCMVSDGNGVPRDWVFRDMINGVFGDDL